METWDEYYSPENLKLLQEIKRLEFGEIKIEVHEKQPIFIFEIRKKKRLRTNDRRSKKL